MGFSPWDTLFQLVARNDVFFSSLVGPDHSFLHAIFPIMEEVADQQIQASGLILGIESSCDETAAAVVRGGGLFCV